MVSRCSVIVGLFACAVLATACDDDDDFEQDVGGDDDGSGAGSAEELCVNAFQSTALVTNQTDPDLVNPWGLVGDEGVFFIADEGTGAVSVYDGAGRPSAEHPTGRFRLGEGITGVARVEDDREAGDVNAPFQICSTTMFTPAELVFANMNGTLIATNDDAPATGVVVVDRSSVGAAYFGVARVDMASGPVLLAADFANGRIDMFDAQFELVEPAAAAATPFSDPQQPANFGPFNVAAFGDRVFVAYAQRAEPEEGEEEEEVEEQPGPGLGAVTIFDRNGTIVGRLQSILLNAPWGLALAEGGFAPGACAPTAQQTLLVGNFGDGRITRFDLTKLTEIDQLTDAQDAPIAIDGLWGITMGNANAGQPGVLYFAAGPNDETGGVYGRMEPAVTTP